MKLLKRILLSLLLVLTAFTSSAEFRWGPTVGVNISELYWKQDLVTDFGLKYVMHGAEVNFGEREIWSSDGFGNEKVWFHTLQIPLNLRFKWTRMNGLEHYVAPFAYGGPVFTFNLATSDLSCIEHPAGSFGLQCGIGAEFLEKFQLSAGYLWGISYDVRTVKLDNFSGRTRGWVVNFAWLF